MTTSTQHPHIAFIGGGNMASAIIGGLIGQGHPANALSIVEPWDGQRERLNAAFPGAHIAPSPSEALRQAQLVVWAVKPQTFKEAAQSTSPWVSEAMHLSVAAGITSGSIAGWLGSERIVRAMPNTPALIARGITGLFARAAVNVNDRSQVERVIKTTGDLVWVDTEAQLDAVTALSGSGPAYVFYFLEAMRNAGVQMGLPPELAQRLAMGTFTGATELAQQSSESLETLRERVTSKGGTTYAALTAMESADIGARFQDAMHAARARAEAMGQDFGN